MSTTITPLQKPKILKKKTTPFNRFQSDRFMRVGSSWRKPRGIDSKIRRQFRGTAQLPSIGFRNKKDLRGVLHNGFRKFRVNNVKELDMLIMQNRIYAAEIAHGVSARNRIKIVHRANQLNIKVLNAGARIQANDA